MIPRAPFRSRHQVDAGGDLLAGGRNQRLDLLGGIRGTLGERAHLGGDDRKAAAGIAGARGLDAGVQRQQIGLERDLVDHADDVADLLRRGLDAVHRRDGLAHDSPDRSASPLAAATTSRA